MQVKLKYVSKYRYCACWYCNCTPNLTIIRTVFTDYRHCYLWRISINSVPRMYSYVSEKWFITIYYVVKILYPRQQQNSPQIKLRQWIVLHKLNLQLLLLFFIVLLTFIFHRAPLDKIYRLYNTVVHQFYYGSTFQCFIYHSLFEIICTVYDSRSTSLRGGKVFVSVENLHYK